MFHQHRRGRAVGVHVWHHHGAYLDSPHDETFCPAHRRGWVLVAATLASSMGFMDRINISLAMPMIRADLGSTLMDAQWIANSYLLLMSSLILMCTALGERFGLRRILGAGIALFAIGALAGALAPGTALLVGARVIQGIGAALMVPTSLAIVAKSYPKSERGKAIGLWMAGSSILLVVGPLIGGALVTTFGTAGWRVLFALNVPLGVAALLALWMRVPADMASNARRLDLTGGLLATAALFLIAYGLTETGSSGIAKSWGQTIAFAGTGLLALIGFVLWEAHAREPLVPLSLFSNKSFSGANAITFLNDFSVSANLFFLPMAIITGWGVIAGTVSVLFLPLPILLGLLSEPSGQLSDRFGPAPLVVVGSIVVAAACAGLAITQAEHDLWFRTLPLMALMALGQAILVTPLSTAVMTSESDEDAIVGSGINNAISRSAWMLSIAAMGAVAAFTFNLHIGDLSGIDLSFGLASSTPLSPELSAARIAASDAAYSAVAWITAILVGASAVIGIFGLEWSNRGIAAQ